MNWSAFFAGAPEGFQKGMKFTQDYNQSQRTNPLEVQKQQLANQQSQAMNPLLQASQGLQNQGLQQNISQGGQNFAREGNAYDAFSRAYGQPGQNRQPPQGQGWDVLPPSAWGQGGQGQGGGQGWDVLPGSAWGQGGQGQGGGGNIPQGMPPTAQPSYGGMANMPHIGGIPQGAGGYMMQPPQNPYGGAQPYYRQSQGYDPSGGGFR